MKNNSDAARFSMLRVYLDGQRVVEKRGLTYAQCSDDKLFPLGRQTDTLGRYFVYSHVLTECI